MRIGRSGDPEVGQHRLPAVGLLCVANFPTNTGYAWHFVESLYAGIADRLASQSVTTWVAYPSMPAPPETLRGSRAKAVELDVRLDSVTSMRAVLDFVRRNNVRIIYLADRSSWHPSYAVLRLAGVRRVIVHDHTSGARTVPRGAKRWLKRVRHRLPGALADRVIAVSDYVASRKVDIDLLQPERVTRIWNSVAIPDADIGVRSRIRGLFGLDQQRVVIACACRATPEKGIVHLLRAFDRLVERWTATTEPPALIYFGDGPALKQLRAERDGLAARAAIFFAGHRTDAADLIAGADICVAPSLWQEAFGLYALEPLARGIPVIASQVGGMPEVVIDGETGVLVPPGNEAALETAMRRLIENPDEAKRLGQRGRRRAILHFTRERQLRDILAVLVNGGGLDQVQGSPRSNKDVGSVAISQVTRSSASARERSEP